MLADGVEASRCTTNTLARHRVRPPPLPVIVPTWFATETKCPVCSARCVGIPDGLREIEAPARKDDDDEREEEQEKEEAP